MIDAIEKVRLFRGRREPTMAIWMVADLRVYGLLSWDSAEPKIELIFEEAELKAAGKTDNALLKATKPPNKPLIRGSVPELGQILLKDCFRYNESQTFDFENRITKHRIVLRPSAIWCGPCLDNEDFTSLTLFDDRLVGFFGQPGFSQHLQWDDRFKDAFQHLKDPSAIWTFKRNQLPSFKLDGPPIEVSVGSTMTNSSSATAGYSMRSFNYISLTAGSPLPAATFNDLRKKIEQIFSTFSLGYFTFAVSEFDYFEIGDQPMSTVCLWRLGEDRSIFNPPMKHQILVDFSKDDAFQKILNYWTRLDDISSLSIWLFCKSLEETEDGTARFIAVAQALEVLGRAIGADKSVEKHTTQKICAAVSNALSDIDGNYKNRIIKLIESSNRSSFRDMLDKMLHKAARHLCIDIDAVPISAFSKTISDTRNNLVHMTTNKNKLNEAFSIVNKLSLRVSFWYAIIIAEQLQIPTPNWQSFLFNNKTARHGLPNDVLEKAAKTNFPETFSQSDGEENGEPRSDGDL